jgi:replication factor C large subunit
MLSETYRPTNISALIGNEQQRVEMVKWLKHWKLGSKALMLIGPPGVGKSTSIHALAREFGYAVIEFNASDVRTRDRLREAIGPTLENKTLFGEEKLLVFLDEIDGISGRSDYAGIDFVLDFIENSRLPVALAANLEDVQNLKKVTQKSLVLKFKPITEDLLFIYLRSIAQRAGISVEENTLHQIARNSRGDVRQALNSLQTISGQTVVASRTDDQFMSDSQALDEIFASKSLEEEISNFRQFDAQPFEKVRAVFEAVVSAKNMSVESRSEALEIIAHADTILGEINSLHAWRLLRYVDRELAVASFGKNLKKTDSSIPWNLKLAIWNDGRVIKSMLGELSYKYHVGRSDFASKYLPYFARFFRENPGALDTFLKQNGFEDSERRVLLKIAQKA